MLQMLFRLYPIICLARNSGGADCPCPVLLCFFINHEHCLQGESSIPKRKVILEKKKEALLASIEELQKSIAYIDWKQNFYDDVLSGRTAYYSNLVPELMKDSE